MDIEHIIRDIHDLKAWKDKAEAKIAALEKNVFEASILLADIARQKVASGTGPFVG